jgi:hypothetical protein
VATPPPTPPRAYLSGDAGDRPVGVADREVRPVGEHRDGAGRIRCVSASSTRVGTHSSRQLMPRVLRQVVVPAGGWPATLSLAMISAELPRAADSTAARPSLFRVRAPQADPRVPEVEPASRWVANQSSTSTEDPRRREGRRPDEKPWISRDSPGARNRTADRSTTLPMSIKHILLGAAALAASLSTQPVTAAPSGYWCFLISDNRDNSVCTKQQDRCELGLKTAQRLGASTSECRRHDTVWVTHYRMGDLDTDWLYVTRAQCELMRELWNGTPCREQR